jgi:thioesterase domain-containing protein
MAAHYATAIRKVQRRGPYFLAGWSFGGLVAFEMAQQLIAAGEPVGWLGLFDSFVLDGLGDVPLEMDRALFASGARQYLEQLGLRLPVAEDVLARHEPAQQVEILLSGLAEAGTEFPQAVAQQARNLLNLWDLNAASGRAYRPRVYSGEITLFRAGDAELAAAGGGPDPVEQWEHLSARTDVWRATLRRLSPRNRVPR